ncbi:MAG: site-specific DNA-methyltransferase [Eubacteriales bacterium]|nr:site-specific DNA-methyltransferase [Eubacteriales bacterium]
MGRNKTIRTTVEEGRAYLEHCVTEELIQSACKEKEAKEPGAADVSIRNATVWGDMLRICPLLKKQSVNLLIADPPYNRRKTYGNRIFEAQKWDDYLEYTRKWVSAVSPLLAPDASIYVCCDWESSAVIQKVLSEHFTVRNRITWQRAKGRGAKNNWKNDMEDIWFATVGNSYYFDLESVKVRRRVLAPYRENGEPKDWENAENGNFRLTCPSNFWDDLTVPFWSMAENTAHPAQKPEKLLAKLIIASSCEGDLVFDPFLGSGTTSVTAKKLGRDYLGIEREARYCVFAEQRLEMAESDPSIQGYEDGVFWERNSRTSGGSGRKSFGKSDRRKK